MHNGLNPREVAFRDALAYLDHKEDLEERDSYIVGKGVAEAFGEE